MKTGKALPHTQQKREQILAAAKRLFLQHGFTATSTDAIKAEAGISKETLYRYYPSKEALFADVLRQLTLEHLPQPLQVERTLLDLQGREAVRAVLLMLAQELVSIMMQPEYLALLRVVVAESARFPHLGTMFREAVPEQSLAYLGTLLARMREQGLVAEAHDDAAARMFLGAILTYALLDGLLAADGVPHPPDSHQLAALVEVFLGAINW